MIIICLKILVIAAGVASLVVHFTKQTRETRELVRAIRTGLEEFYFVLMMVYTCVLMATRRSSLSREDAILVAAFAVVVVYSYTIEIVRGYVKPR